jgi:hypothetical protein
VGGVSKCPTMHKEVPNKEDLVHTLYNFQMPYENCMWVNKTSYLKRIITFNLLPQRLKKILNKRAWQKPTHTKKLDF